MKLLLRAFIWISLIAAGAYSQAPEQLVYTTIPSTHPQVRYTPETYCNKYTEGKCTGQYDPFKMSTYVDGNLRRRTFFHTTSWGNIRKHETMSRTVEVQFYGREAYLYGPPLGQLDYRPAEQVEVYVDGWHITDINLEANYLFDNPKSRDPHFIYHWKSDGDDSHHVLRLTLWDDATGVWAWYPIRTFGFDSLVVTSRERQDSSSNDLSERKDLESVTIHDTNLQVSFAPHGVWKMKESPVTSSDGFRTFHEISSDVVSGLPDQIPIIEFIAQCSAIAVYGAPPAYFMTKGERNLKHRHGHVQLCVGGDCDYIDIHNAYLNVSDKLSNEPVLLYRTSGTSLDAPALVSMRLLDPQSAMGYVWTMTFSHAVCWKGKPKRPWAHPIPNGSYDTRVRQHHELSYHPPVDGSSPRWQTTDQYSLARVEPHDGSEPLDEMPSWSTTLIGHDIKIYVPVLPLTSTTRHADVLCCIDGDCHHPDIEQWLRRAKSRTLDLPLVHYKDLDPFQKHHISMTALPRESASGAAIIAVSRIIYEQVVIETQSSPAHSSAPIEDDNPLPEKTPSTEAVFDHLDVQPTSNSELIAVVATIVTLWMLHCFRGDLGRDQQIPEVPSPNRQDQSTLLSHSVPPGEYPDEPNSGEPAFSLPSPPTAESVGVPTVFSDNTSPHGPTPSTSEFTFSSIELPSTTPGSNSLALSVSSFSPQAQPMTNPSHQDRRPLSPMNSELDYESPFLEHRSPPYVFVGVSTGIPPFVGSASTGGPADSPRSSQSSTGQRFANNLADEGIGSTRGYSWPDVPRFAVDGEQREEAGNSSERGGQF
ncbi:hypothetical protein FRC04_009180 [Tulasnella sp. 424]|nr:hypothetical protein FRC04_009180 [Tulasnella sp. 424]